eukprot:CAMPEP_0206208848 /NCGR_PEP_ID=MMETSP0166-20121206/16534_1 /ASSEMBLY_ACC=CAM_ASM_000260 /TAXON_ID=95228 /ORGANISM="Vannella robusta, Strain DIVA3 518/3/11/1/6" /LENGTH=191 /DNA_ID=CAMNT_0053630085 /DNA_START=209 /DNA_END=781 /DNA_ORIENTATION=+
MRRGKEEFLPTTIELKVGDPKFMKSFSFNERFAYILLEQHYFRYFLQDPDLYEFYGKLLCGLLRNADMEELSIPLCKEIAWFALKNQGREYLLKEGIILQLYKLLNCLNEVVIAEAGTALVNLLANNKEAKVTLLSCGAIRMILSKFLSSPGKYSPHTICVMLKLLRTTANSYQRQIEVTKENGLVLLSDL